MGAVGGGESVRAAKVRTVWECWEYDVRGNAKDGYEVNDRYCIAREHEIRIKPEVCNPGSRNEFLNVFPSDKQIRQALNIAPRVRIEVDGDDRDLYVTAACSGYPLGEMHRVDKREVRQDMREEGEHNG